MIKLLAFITLVTTIITITYITSTTERTIDPQTKELCRQYAQLDHEKELAPERWQWFIDQGINPNTHFDWYQSCIDHIRYPVAVPREYIL